jgi:hypothetical protein
LIRCDGVAEPMVEPAVHGGFRFVIEGEGWDEAGGDAFHGA